MLFDDVNFSEVNVYLDADLLLLVNDTINTYYRHKQIKLPSSIKRIIQYIEGCRAIDDNYFHPNSEDDIDIEFAAECIEDDCDYIGILKFETFYDIFIKPTLSFKEFTQIILNGGKDEDISAYSEELDEYLDADYENIIFYAIICKELHRIVIFQQWKEYSIYEI